MDQSNAELSVPVTTLGHLRDHYRGIIDRQISLLQEAVFKIKNLTQYNRDLTNRLSGFEDAVLLVKVGGGNRGEGGVSGRDITYDIERHLEEMSFSDRSKMEGSNSRPQLSKSVSADQATAGLSKKMMSEETKNKIRTAAKRSWKARKNNAKK